MRAARMPSAPRSAVRTGKDVLQQVFGKHTRRKFLAGLRLKVRFRSGTCATTGGKISLQAEHSGVSLPRPSTRFVYSHDKLPALKYQRNGDELRRASVDYWWGISSGRCPILSIFILGSHFHHRSHFFQANGRDVVRIGVPQIFPE